MTREEHLAQIKQADAVYYGNSGEVILSDAEYDALRRDYIDKYGSEDLDYVPGADLGAAKFQHPHEAKSLGKIDETETDKLLAYIEKFQPVVVEPKLDGCSIVVYPQNGEPMYVTRGGGDEGDILTRFPSHPRDVKYTAEYPIRGEVYMDFAAFEQMNAELEAQQEKKRANPRNSVNPILTGGKHPEFVKYLSFQAYDVMGVDWSESEKMAYILEHTPFAVSPMLTFADETPAEIAARIPVLYQEYEKELGYPIDGLVIKCNWADSLQKFGTTDHHDNNAIAWKPSQIPVSSVVRDVHWQVGKTGALTPVADIEPVDILGTMVSNVNLHNMNVVKRLGGVAIGDKVGVIKAKLIIPQLVIVYEHNGGEAIEAIDCCPYCHAPLEQRANAASADEDDTNLFCINPHCQERIAQQIGFLAKRNVLDISDLSIDRARALVRTFPEKAEAAGPYMIFALTAEDIRAAIITPFAELTSTKQKIAAEAQKGNVITAADLQDTRDLKSPDKLKAAIDAARAAVDIPRFVKALLFDGIGDNIGKLLAEKYQTAENILAALARKDAFQEIDGIGPRTEEILQGQDFYDRFAALLQYIKPQAYAALVVDAAAMPYAGKVFVLTGKDPDGKPRNFYKELIEAAGAKMGAAVSGNTDFLVIADPASTSSKAVKARKLGTKLISYQETAEMLQ
ncbi:DNA ligase (NAD+) [Selenomonas sp. GACV-9]|uniref:BRCT domain-containing protein n=1 Tax=Selenomonas sp. GACV-9 TaxID=3158782 RepID=UPI0008E1843D|nr:DNA ligase (NAD+) [Selenomonas ruminantium]